MNEVSAILLGYAPGPRKYSNGKLSLDADWWSSIPVKTDYCPGCLHTKPLYQGYAGAQPLSGMRVCVSCRKPTDSEVIYRLACAHMFRRDNKRIAEEHAH